ncbi:MAG: hypothetical protein J6R82_03410 [Clostridia bacterium]|nr:hypothetical protein [Clostridia bacterium]
MKFLKLRLWWSDKTTLEKVLYVIKDIVASVACVFIILMVTGVWDYGFAAALPCWVVVWLLSVFEIWDEHRRLAIFNLCAVVLFILLIIAIGLGVFWGLVD